MPLSFDIEEKPKVDRLDFGPNEAFRGMLKKTLGYEGEFTIDHAGKTNRGVTQDTYNSYRRDKKLPSQDVRKITDNEVEDLYYSNYYKKPKFDTLPPKIGAVLFDYGVNSGPRRATVDLQKIVGAQPDGVIGDNTVTATQKYIDTLGEDKLTGEIINSRQQNYQKLININPAKYKKFEKGWLNRIKDLKDEYLPKLNPLHIQEAGADEIPEKKTNRLDFGIANNTNTEIHQAPPKTIIDSIKSFFRESPERGIAKAQNIYALSEVTGLPIREVSKNYDALRKIPKITGMTPGVSNEEYLATVLTPAIVTGAISNPIGTVAGLIAYGALDKLIPTKEFIPSDANDETKTTIELVDFIGKGAIVGGIFAKSPKLVERFTKDKITEYNLPKTIKLSAEQVRDIRQTGKLTTPEQVSLYAELGLTGQQERQAFKEGIDILVPAEKITRVVDKPYWQKIKAIFGVKPSEETGNMLAGKPEQARLAIEGAQAQGGSPIAQPAAGGMTAGRVIPPQITKWLDKGINITSRGNPIKITQPEAQIKDINGKMVDLPKGHEMTPYKLSNGKIWLHDGKDVIVEPGQLQNLENKNLVLGEKKLTTKETQKEPYQMTQEEFNNIPIIKYTKTALKEGTMTVSERDKLANQMVEQGLMSIDDFNAITGQHGFGGVSGVKNLSTGQPIPSKSIDLETDMGAKINYIGQWHSFRVAADWFAHRHSIIRALEEGKIVPKDVLAEYVGVTSGTGEENQSEWAEDALRKLYPGKNTEEIIAKGKELNRIDEEVTEIKFALKDLNKIINIENISKNDFAKKLDEWSVSSDILEKQSSERIFKFLKDYSIRTDSLYDMVINKIPLPKEVAKLFRQQKEIAEDVKALSKISNQPMAGGMTPPPEQPPIAIAGEPAPKEPKRHKIDIETIRPDQYGKTALSKAIEKMQDRLARVDAAQYALDDIESIRKQFIRRISKYRDNYLKEELTGIPAIYITKDGGLKPDEAMEEMRARGIDVNNESELKEFLINLEAQKKELESDIRANRPQLVTHKETTLLYDKIKVFEQGLREGRTRTIQDIQSAQNEIISMLEDASLEPKDKAKFLRMLKNIKGMGQLRSTIKEIADRVQTIKEQTERSETIQDLRDLFSRMPTENLPIGYKDKIEEIKATIELKTRQPATRKRLENMRQFVERMEAEGEEINIPNEKLALLDKHTVDEFTTDELKQLQETVQRLYHLGKLKDKLLTAQQDRQVAQIVLDVVKEITGGKGLSSDGSFINYLKQANLNLAGKTKEEIKNYILKNLRPEVLINALADFKQDSITVQALWDIFSNANTAELEEGNQSTRQLWDIFKDINVPAAYTKKHNIGRFKQVTRNNALFIFAHSRNAQSLNHLLASGLTEEDINAFENFLTVPEKEAVGKLWEYYDKNQWPRVEAVYAELEGIHLGKEEFYFPIMNLELAADTYGKEIEKELLKRFHLKQAAVSKGFTKERVPISDKAFGNFDFFGTILKNHEQVEHYIAFARGVRDVRKVLHNPDTRAAIEQSQGKEYFRVLDRWFKDVAYGGNHADLNWLDKFSSFLTENYVTSVLGYNLLSSLKSGTSYLAGVDMAGDQASLKGLVKFAIHPLSVIQFVNNKSSLMRHRDFTQEREWKKILAGKEKYLGQTKIWQQFKEKSAFPMMFGDKVTTYPLWIAAYDDYIGKGFSDEEAKEWADTVIRRTQPMGQVIYLPEAYRSPGIAKAYTLFTNQLNQNFNRFYEQTYKLSKGKIRAGNYARTQLYLMILSGLLIGYLARRRSPTIGEFAADSITQVSGGLVLVGRLVDALAQALASGRPARLGEAISPITFKPAENLGQALTAKKPETRLKHALTGVSQLTGIPFVEIKRVLEGEPIFGKEREETSGEFNLRKGSYKSHYRSRHHRLKF